MRVCVARIYCYSDEKSGENITRLGKNREQRVSSIE